MPRSRCGCPSRVLALALMLLCCAPTVTAAQDQDTAVARPSYLGGVLTYYLVGHATAIPHELAHGLTGILTGGQFRGWKVRPLMQYVLVTADAEWKVVLIRVAGPLANRFTAELPRWIYPPERDGLYYRSTGAYAFQSRMQPLFNCLISWLPLKTVHDCRRVAGALSRTTAGEFAVLALLTAATGTDVYLNWDEIWSEYEVFWGQRLLRDEDASSAVRAERTGLAARRSVDVVWLAFRF